jgi:6,7-dimethyl-8-ribityllumazine synthase
MAIDRIEPDLDGTDLRIGLVQSRFNDWAGSAMTQACLAELQALGVDEGDVTLVTVPGALEVPVALAKLAATEDFDGLIALGCVVRGETYHFEVVANESARGVAQVALSYGVPVANAILTTEDEAQARARLDDKAREAARVAVEMANLMWTLEEDGDEDGDE